MNLIVDGIVFRHHPIGGVARYFNEILPRICNLDDEFKLTFLSPWEYRETIGLYSKGSVLKVPPFSRLTYRIPFLRGVGGRVETLLARSLSGLGNNSIWHSTYNTVPEFWPGMKVVTIYDLIYEIFPHLYQGPLGDKVRFDQKRAVESADAVICISETTRKDALNFYDINEQSTFVTYLGVTDSFKDDHKYESSLSIENPFILFVGERKGYKNFNCLLEAFSDWKMRDEVKLIAIGKPWDYEEKEFIVNKGIDDRVEVISSISDDELANLYSESEAVIHTSLYEGFGFPIVEALAKGSKLVASDIPTTREIAGDIPMYFDPHDSMSLIDALTIAIETQLSEKEIYDIKKHTFQYNWDNTAMETIKVYKSL
ncbi:MAG: glycosyltransferase family 4 protein [SAR202 cluster bacterium]|nr:glycosyltransferase family 4 protein [SAR202 cluster bacterium]MQG16208.1 glycosyltransferase family 4 protein [SAR202 cluster bacterium]|tara:strand:+ start:2524 stop:3633 length:1110 start_codon:yes stop_codon:yes gene_type:complete